MRPIHGVLASLLLVIGLLVAAFALPEPPAATGGPHPRVDAMRVGTPIPDGDPRLVIGWALGCAVIVWIGALVRFGGAQRADRRPLRRRLLLVTVLHLACWSWMVIEVQAYQGGATAERWAALPRPTAVLLLAFWPVSLGYSALFVTGFGRWVLTEEERRRFRALVEQRGADG